MAKNGKSNPKEKPGAAYMAGSRPKGQKDPSCPAGGYVYGHSRHGGKSPSPKRGKG